ncbi:MAG: ABC transporter permease [Nitrospira sp.]|nr:ABC transporter permease [Nitrospira sp.]
MTDAVALPPPARASAAARWFGHWPVALVVGVGLVVWYAAAVWLNAPRVIEQLQNAGTPWGTKELVAAAWSMQRPVLPAPHQILVEFVGSMVGHELDSPRNLLFHAGVTLNATVLGFLLGVVLGVAIAIGVVHNRVLDRGLLPWIIASQTIPILAIAPMVVVVLGSMGYPPLMSKAVISMYLCFFPVAIGMVKGLRSPDPLQLDLMRTYSASRRQLLAKLRFPAALPFLFASAKVAIATSLIGAIVGELPTGAQAGLGARLLQGSYFGQTIQIWSALLMASLLGVLLVAAVSGVERGVNRLMGARPA